MTIKEAIASGTLRGTRTPWENVCDKDSAYKFKRKTDSLAMVEAQIFNLFAPYLSPFLTERDSLSLQVKLGKLIQEALPLRQKGLKEDRENGNLD